MIKKKRNWLLNIMKITMTTKQYIKNETRLKNNTENNVPKKAFAGDVFWSIANYFKNIYS